MEYPFKDLLPLDEVLEREGYYKDWTHLDPKVFYSLTQISEYIKTKGYGVDVRLMIAQLAEHFSLKTSQINQIEQMFKDVMQELTEDKDYHSLPEISAARGGFDTLGDRLNDATTQLEHIAVSIESFKGSGGSSDYTYAFRAALNYLVSRGGGTLQLGAQKTYHINTISLNIPDNVIIEIEGNHSTIISEVGGNGSGGVSLFLVKPSENNDKCGFYVRNVTIDASSYGEHWDKSVEEEDLYYMNALNIQTDLSHFKNVSLKNVYGMGFKVTNFSKTVFENIYTENVGGMSHGAIDGGTDSYGDSIYLTAKGKESLVLLSNIDINAYNPLINSMSRCGIVLEYQGCKMIANNVKINGYSRALHFENAPDSDATVTNLNVENYLVMLFLMSGFKKMHIKNVVLNNQMEMPYSHPTWDVMNGVITNIANEPETGDTLIENATFNTNKAMTSRHLYKVTFKNCKFTGRNSWQIDGNYNHGMNKRQESLQFIDCDFIDTMLIPGKSLIDFNNVRFFNTSAGLHTALTTQAEINGVSGEPIMFGENVQFYGTKITLNNGTTILSNPYFEDLTNNVTRFMDTPDTGNGSVVIKEGLYNLNGTEADRYWGETKPTFINSNTMKGGVFTQITST